MSKKKPIDPIPEEFDSYEQAAEFWDTHDTTNYPGGFSAVKVHSKLKKHRMDLEIDSDVVSELQTQARRKGVAPGRLATDILRQRLATHK